MEVVKMEKKTKEKKNSKKQIIRSAKLNDQNSTYLDFYNKKTRHSYNALINACVDYARTNDGLKTLEAYEPVKVRNARRLLEGWSKTEKRASK
jgi:hypothetical protein